MKKDEAERGIRHLCSIWADERGYHSGIYSSPDFHPSFADFKRWIHEKGYSSYLDFRSSTGSEYDAESWFDQEFRQTWRN